MNPHAHSSLAAIIDYSAGAGTSTQEEDIARYIVSEAYGGGVDEGGASAAAGGGVLASPAPAPDAPAPARAASPLDPTLDVAPALLALAADVLGDAPALAGLPVPATPADAAALAAAWDSERGEMGGKRKKAPHLRAGWREMDEAAAAGAGGVPSAGERRVRRRVDADAPEAAAGHVKDDAGGLDGHGHGHGGLLDGPMGDLGEGLALGEAAAAESGGDNMDGGDGGDGEDGPNRGKRMTKEQRAQQNRRAQQVYRRKREERIKQLELESAMLAQAREALAALEARYLDLALDLEAKKIEAAGLQSAIAAAVTAGAPPRLAARSGRLVLDPPGAGAREPEPAVVDPTAADCGRAFDRLAREARQVAKMQRARREARAEGGEA